jgi:hypothetical protein
MLWETREQCESVTQIAALQRRVNRCHSVIDLIGKRILLHNQRAAALKLMLYIKGNGRIFVINVPRYVRF